MRRQAVPTPHEEAHAFLATVIGRQRHLPEVQRLRGMLGSPGCTAEKIDKALAEARRACRGQAETLSAR